MDCQNVRSQKGQKSKIYFLCKCVYSCVYAQKDSQPDYKIYQPESDTQVGTKKGKKIRKF